MNKILGNKFAIFVFVFPMLLLFSAFVIFPIIPAISISMQEHNGFRSNGFVGFHNYMAVLKNSLFWHASLNNIIIVAISTCIFLPVSLILAMILDFQTASIKRFFKMSSFIPAVLSVTVICQMWIGILQPQWGIVNSALRAIGLDKIAIDWLADEKTGIVSVAIVFLWQWSGFNMLLFYSGIKSIPKTYYEAALIDGANNFQSALKITIPLLQEVTKFVLLVTILGCMAQFAHVRIMTGGGPGDASYTIVYYMYTQAFTASDFGTGCAISVLFVIECLIITLIINRFVAREKLQF